MVVKIFQLVMPDSGMSYLTTKKATRSLKKRSERRKDKEKIDEEAQLTAVSEHSETSFDAVFPSEVVFSRPNV